MSVLRTPRSTSRGSRGAARAAGGGTGTGDPPTGAASPGAVRTGLAGTRAAPLLSDYARRAVLAAAGSRLLLVLVSLVTTYTVGVRERALYLRYPAHAEALHGFVGRLLSPWAHWDGVWFVRIAADGYAAHTSSEAFFPLYPLLVRAVAAGVGDHVVAGLIVSLVCYSGAMIVLFRLVRTELGSEVALWSVVLLSVFPTALFFQAVYSEALFLLLTLLAFWWARGGRWALAGLAGMLAVLTRSSGLLLLAPLALLWWEQWRGAPVRLPGGPARPSRGEPSDPAPSPVAAALPDTCALHRDASPRPSRLSWLWILLVPAGLALYMAYLWLAFRQAMLFSTVQAAWGRELTLPTTAVWRGIATLARAVAWLVGHGPAAVLGTHTDSGGLESDVIANVLELSGFAAAVAMLVACWRRLPAAWTLYALAALAFPLFYSSEARPLYSVPRFVVVVFPLFVGAAAVLVPRPLWRWLVTAVFVVLLVCSTVLFASFI